MSRLIISFYDQFDSACEAIRELTEKGFRKQSISLVAHEAACTRVWGGERSDPWLVLGRPLSFHLPGIGPVLVSGYCTDSFQTEHGRAISLVHVLEKQMVPEVDAHAYAEGVRRRGILVFLKAERATSSRALTILDQYCPVDILALTEQWRSAGWTHFDDQASPLVADRSNWPNSITALPGDRLLDNQVSKNWPQNIVRRWPKLN